MHTDRAIMCTPGVPQPPHDISATGERLADPPGSDLSGVVLGGRYRLRHPLGRCATLYHAVRTTLDAPSLVRVVPGLGLGADAEQFLLRARAASHLHHGHIARVTDFGISTLAGGTPVGYLVMEPLHGENLISTLADHGPMPWTRVVAIAKQVCRALIAAADHGVVHGGIRLGNCLRIDRPDAQDFIKLLDFGVARPDAPPPCLADDLHAVGVLMFRLLTGRGPDPLLTLRNEPTALTLPSAFMSVLLAALSREPRLRPSSARSLYRALAAIDAAAPQRSATAPAPSSASPTAATRPAATAEAELSASCSSRWPLLVDWGTNATSRTPARTPDPPATDDAETWPAWTLWLPLGLMTSMIVHSALFAL